MHLTQGFWRLAPTIQQYDITLPTQFPQIGNHSLIALNETVVVVFLQVVVDKGLVLDFQVVDDGNHLTTDHKVGLNYRGRLDLTEEEKGKLELACGQVKVTNCGFGLVTVDLVGEIIVL